MTIFKCDFGKLNSLKKYYNNINNLNLEFSAVIHLACPKIKLKRFYEYSWKEINDQILVQFRSIFFIIKNLIKQRKIKNNIKFFIISSYITKVTPPKGLMPYILGKVMLEKFFEILKNELTGTKVKIFIIRPKEFNSSLRSLLPNGYSSINKGKSIVEINKVTKIIKRNI